VRRFGISIAAGVRGGTPNGNAGGESAKDISKK
jgi:hypothetical protein